MALTKKEFRQRLQVAPAVVAPGVYDPLTALIAEQAGFEALYLSGGAVAYTQLGRSDVGLTTAKEAMDVLFRITDRSSLPVIVDGDTGFGNAINVQRTVRDFEERAGRAGAAMIQLEDQTFPKRCGHLENKSVISSAEMCGKLKAALDARHSPDTLILARTDAAAHRGSRCRAGARRGLSRLWRRCSVHRGGALRQRDGHRLRPLRFACADARQHGRGRQDADPECR